MGLKSLEKCQKKSEESLFQNRQNRLKSFPQFISLFPWRKTSTEFLSLARNLCFVCQIGIFSIHFYPTDFPLTDIGVGY